MLDAPVHAALVTLMTWLVNYLFGLIGLDLGGEVVTGLATVLVGYILSLFGLALYVAGRTRAGFVNSGGYKPPFV